MIQEYKATHYASDLTDSQGNKIEKYFPSGNKSRYHKRSLVEAVLLMKHIKSTLKIYLKSFIT